MSGGIAWVLDERGDFESRCNREMVNLEPLSDDEEVELVLSLIRRHAALTGSVVAVRVLRDVGSCPATVRAVMPRDYQRALSATSQLLTSSRRPLPLPARTAVSNRASAPERQGIPGWVA